MTTKPRIGGAAMVDSMLEMREMSKRYPGVLAVDRVNLTVLPGEVHVIAGENGAGKSTLMKLLSQVERPDEGVVRLDGKPVEFRGPRFAQLTLGVSMVHQEMALAAHLTVAENLCLGEESTRLGVLSRRAERKRAQALLDRVNLAVDPGRPVGTLPVADRQRVEIAKALGGTPRVVIMDEPTAMLTEAEITDLFEVIAELKEQGIAIVYISHRLDEVAHLADQVTVLRDGRVVQTLPPAQVSPQRLIRLMVGRDIDSLYPKPRARIGKVLLRAEGISRRGRAVDLVDCTVEVRAGEIVGFAGLVGSGRTELVRAIFGADIPDAGRVFLRGREIRIRSPRQGIEAGLGYLTEDRQGEGLALQLPVDQNITLARVPLRFGAIDLREERRTALSWRDRLGIKTPSIKSPVQALSGGNQQKVVVAKWLETTGQVLFFDEPARGIDVGAKAEIFDLIGRLAGEGRGIVLISSYLPELLNMCDRIIVLRAGRIAGELACEQFSEERVMQLATGAPV
ncbi:MAG TPA: sugar ABC transporter ATP-binding protein [Pseudonocardiaceae bacterium]|nr:sugar ABC transporter ATP-binding protein [Pseudonocardiaceae bacterium]